MPNHLSEQWVPAFAGMTSGGWGDNGVDVDVGSRFVSPYFGGEMDKQFFVYMMASAKRGTIYTGVTSDLVGRLWQHRTHAIEDSFTARYGVTRLVWFEEQGSAEAAIVREKRIKEWRRAWKVELIEERNPRWDDLWDQII